MGYYLAASMEFLSASMGYYLAASMSEFFLLASAGEDATECKLLMEFLEHFVQ